MNAKTSKALTEFVDAVVKTDKDYVGGTQYWISLHDKVAIELARLIPKYMQLQQELSQVREELAEISRAVGFSASEYQCIAYQALHQKEQRDQLAKQNHKMREALGKVESWLIKNTDIEEVNPLLDQVVIPAMSANTTNPSPNPRGG